jgi:hypothetical protein
MAQIIHYDNGLLRNVNGTYNWASNDFTAVLLTDDYTPSAAHNTFSNISANECVDADYARQAIGSKTISLVGGEVFFGSAAISFGIDVTISAKYVAFVQGTPVGITSASTLLGYADLNEGGGELASTNSIFRLTPDADGWWKI